VFGGRTSAGESGACLTYVNGVAKTIVCSKVNLVVGLCTDNVTTIALLYNMNNEAKARRTTRSLAI
jgi:hypothetical protein